MSNKVGSATEIRTPVPALRGLCPGPLDDGASDTFLPDSNPGSSPRTSASAPTNRIAKRSTGIQTPICCPDVSIPEAELSAARTSHYGAPVSVPSSVDQAGGDRVSSPASVRKSTRRCERCGKLLARTSPNTRFDVPFHKSCFAMNEEERVAANPPAPLAESPLKGLLW